MQRCNDDPDYPVAVSPAAFAAAVADVAAVLLLSERTSKVPPVIFKSFAALSFWCGGQEQNG